ncbi:MAG TPA: AbrB/MazE/SpoVT family DNA-binding domain-containing protein [Candidatus Thermoplasmatota archaeon]|nr:AbrB/MazE/SpoVT family DNA-binding domain-containing protein [Candidatus Thermoplasmatota archaeon]
MRGGDINPRLVDKHMRVVLPKDVTAALHLRQGDHVHFDVRHGDVVVRKAA